MWENIQSCIVIVLAIVFLFFALKGIKYLIKCADAREEKIQDFDASWRHGYDLDEQEKHRIEENR